MGLVLKPLFSIVSNGAGLYLLTILVKDISYGGGIKFFVVGGLVLGIINLIVKPIIKILSLPLVILTGGLFLVVINVGVLRFFEYFIGVIQFQNVTLDFPNFMAYVIGAVVLGVINSITSLFS